MDVPVHRNAGDLFILAVTTRLFADLDCRIVFRTGLRDYRATRARRHVGRDTIVVGLGGGNFGDDYPRYQALRERIVADFPRHRIVILPQTVHFGDRGAREKALRQMAGHPDLRIGVRDPASREALSGLASQVELLPDIVHAFGEMAAHDTPQRRGPSLLLRRDQEGVRPDGAEPAVDWPEVFPDLIGRVALAAAAMPVAPGRINARLHEAWGAYAGDIYARARAWMQGAEYVVTDRLHAAIVARLVGRPVTLRDNGYGKLASYYDAWWRDDPDVTLQRCGGYSTNRGCRS